MVKVKAVSCPKCGKPLQARYILGYLVGLKCASCGYEKEVRIVEV